MCLDLPAIETTLRAMAGHGSALLCNFVLHEDDCDQCGRAVRAAASRAVSAVGEPLVTTIHPPEIDRDAGSTR